MEHAGKHALVTGGGQGIGKGIALALAQAGAQVTITGRTGSTLEQTAALDPRLHPLVMDVSDEASVRDGISAAAAERGKIQICVANAGIAESVKFADCTMADWRRMMATNLDGVFVTLQAALATLEKEDWGRMIVVSSIAGVKGLRNAIPYTVSKHGVIGLIHGLSEEYRPRPITFNALCPGYVDTEIVASQIPGLMQRFDVDEAGARAVIAKGNRSKTLLDVDEITAAAMYVCSDGARNFNGQTVEISGGQV
ncbi:SDR family NAD(P)-dependent oxidoreductase [Yoonia sediminilitoris]|uniref:NAD(P)-dependent dehydrogenase (Short-subunit alcohol dehydrogenase family) n=1 Tax=Yoonia sediminilitoris TaxID=1286148 RepID=A0A2T6KR64_9RHOB|nr:SDR family oxidoreductase [Yoonia sediminilitoris]PUB19025.1 NAD(P)-dependent dehydrogenase (short-subunit alcohol dehydrogenase family) [Yoonia sediminilitoris]RCW99193.1 NAD(P)-dependent dehydrogenase (short-subunit alcohol dehydrogenase family) [Yoonia sediminilitoris]